MVPVCQRPFSKCLQIKARPSARGVSVCAGKQERPVSAELALLATLATLSAAPAYADVDDAVGTAVESVKAAGEALKAGKGLFETAVGAAGSAYESVSPQINDAIGKASPVVKSTIDEVSKVAVPAAKNFSDKAIPIVRDGTTSLLKSSGIDVTEVTKSADSASKSVSEAASVATPTINKVAGFLTTSSPETLAKVAVAAVAIYYLTPFAFQTAVSSFRGYAGEVTPARAVDIVASDDNVAVVDIRSLKEKSAVGVPDVPSSARGRFIELEVAEIDRRLRGQLKNVDGVEAQVTALEIQALKRVNKRTSLLLLDKNGAGPAKAVAKELSGLGFSNVFVITGGFNGWVSSKLQVKLPVPGQKSEGLVANILGTISTRPKPQATKKVAGSR